MRHVRVEYPNGMASGRKEAGLRQNGWYFQLSKVSKEEVVAHLNLVWADTAFDVTLLAYNNYCDPLHVSVCKQNVLHDNNQKPKHVIMGKNIWASLTSAFKIEISGKETKFEQGEEYNRFLLWKFIRHRVNSMITMAPSYYKTKIKKATLADHNNDIVIFNTWFDGTRSNIFKGKGRDTTSISTNSFGHT